ncbi:uncharacterized protein L201_002566 [Kwoniella dendrophila CBS 6074]|uniref:Uncharacterized protein n=1 Tax=Kwoniella dendrophila CBS 6074 TaxID=1295534 RepID=A0AAX4JSV6_9TREE
MSSTTTSTTTTSSSSYPTYTNNNSGGSNPGSFYKNLFYILIGLLCAFGLVSFLSLMRARRRRNAIVREANRLGVIVPGIPGYIPLRDRRNLNWLKSDGSNHPDWWEIEKKSDINEVYEQQDKEERILAQEQEQHGENSVNGHASSSQIGQGRTDKDEFFPLAIIPPPPPEHKIEPIPWSNIPFFPNHLAYRPESLLPTPSKFSSLSSHNHNQQQQNKRKSRNQNRNRQSTDNEYGNDDEIINELVHEKIEVLTIIKMPIPPDHLPKPKDPSREADDEDPEDVVREWGGIELGITHLNVSQGNKSW